MDAQAVSAALTPAALAPAIAKRLGLPPVEVESALGLLAQGAQPAFIARYRGDRVKDLRIDDLEQIQTAAAQAVGFELRRQQVAAELAERGTGGIMMQRELLAASHPLDLDDVRSVGTRKKRSAVVHARIGGLTPLALALWNQGSSGDFSDPDAIPSELLAVPSRAALGKKRKRKRNRKKPAPVEVTAEDTEAPTGDPRDMAAGDRADKADPVPAQDGDAADGLAAATTAASATELAAPADDAESDSIAASEPERAPLPEAGASAESAEGAEKTEKTTAAADAAAAEPPATPDPEPQEPEIPTFDGVALAAAVTPQAVPDDAEALAGALSICAELIVEHPGVRRLLRRVTMTRGKLTTAVVESKKDRAGRYTKFFERAEVCSSMAPNNVLAVQRAERDGLLTVTIEVDPAMICDEVAKLLEVSEEGPAAAALRQAIEDAWTHGGLGKAICGGVRRQMKERADRAVIPNLCEALRPQLLSPAFGRRPLLCIDPGTQHGCRLVVLSPEGTIAAEETVFPLQPKLQAPQAKARVAALCTEYGIELIVVVGGSGAREVEKLARAALAEAAEPAGGTDVPVHTVDSDAVGSLAGSKAVKAELPKADAATRRAVCAGRRVQDPLTTLAKADLRKLSLGQHQFDVDPEALRQALEQVVGTSIAKVSVDLNTVDADTLARVPGMSQALAKAVIAHRDAKDGFRSRNELLEVPGLVGKAFEQSAGFLRVLDGEHPLDATSIHPERYAQVTQMARALDTTVAELLGDAAKVDALDPEPFFGQPGVSGEPLGPRALSQVQAALRQPSRDPRPPFEVAAFHPDLASFTDLKVGMELEGVITHLAGFGAFVDVGIAQEGLIHLSELSHEYVSAAADVVHIGQRVKGKVIEITGEKKRFALSLKALTSAPERPARDRPQRGGDRPRDGRPAKGGGKGKGRPSNRGHDKGGGRKEPREEKVLGFRMDLSELASRLGKG